MKVNACGDYSGIADLSNHVRRILWTTNRYRSFSGKLENYQGEIEKLLPLGIEADVKNLVYSFDGESGREVRELSELKVPRNKFFKSMSEVSQRTLARTIDGIYNVSHALYSEFGEGTIKSIAANIFTAMRSRDGKAVELAAKVVGSYDLLAKENAALLLEPSSLHKDPVSKTVEDFDGTWVILSCDPLDIFTKSTARPWEGQSCERYGGEFHDGVYSDIEGCSIVCFVFDENSESMVARIMLRRCYHSVLVKKSKYDDSSGTATRPEYKRIWGYGIEKYFYTAGGQVARKSRKLLGGTVEARVITAFLENMLDKEGLMQYADGSICTTPYSYNGFSDVMGRGDTEIGYTRNLKKCDGCGELFSPAALEDGLCANCEGGSDD